MADENGKDLVDETTEEVTDAGGEAVDKAKEVADDAAETGQETAGEIKEKAGEAAEAASDAANAAVDKVKALAGDAADSIGDASGAVGETAGAAADKGKEAIGAAIGSASEAFDGDGDTGSVLKWLLPLLLLGVLLVLLFMFFSQSSVEGPAANTNASNEETSNTEAVGETEESLVTVEAKDGKYAISGVVADEATKASILKEAEAIWGSGNVDVNGLNVSANATPHKEGWWDGFRGLLPSLKDWKDGSISWTKGEIKTVGSIPGEVADKIKSLFEGWVLPVSIAGEEDAAKAANEKAMEMLSDADSVEKVVEGMNATVINFASGKSDVPEDAKTVLEKAASALRKLSPETVIEIGGHTDNTGNADSNMKLSSARAESVRKALIALEVNEKMLTAKGYGDTVPKGDNNTDEGRFSNRRIEYKAASGAENASAPAEPASDK